MTDAFALMADVTETDWHSLRTIDIDYDSRQPNTTELYDWKDTRFYSLGAEFALSDAFTLRAGVALDETPVSDETRTPRLPDNDRTLFSIGATWHATDALSVDAAYQRINIKTPSIDAFTSLGTELTGKFSGHADLFGVSAQYRF